MTLFYSNRLIRIKNYLKILMFFFFMNIFIPSILIKIYYEILLELQL